MKNHKFIVALALVVSFHGMAISANSDKPSELAVKAEQLLDCSTIADKKMTELTNKLESEALKDKRTADILQKSMEDESKITPSDIKYMRTTELAKLKKFLDIRQAHFEASVDCLKITEPELAKRLNK